MECILVPNRAVMGHWVAQSAAEDLRRALSVKERVKIVVATGASQFEVLDHLVASPDIDWSRVDGFHLDEYVGLGVDHPASFCRYLRERFVSRVPLGSFHYLRGDADPDVTIEAANAALDDVDIDLALVGIGENGHLAFNDPPANLEATRAYIQVPLDEACRQQQVNEGWFPTLEAVPTHAITMTIFQILRSKKIYCSVPDAQKANAVQDTLEQPIGAMYPASTLRTHTDVTLVIDDAASAKLSPESLSQFRRTDENTPA